MLRLRPTSEEIAREARTHRLRILPGKDRRTQQGLLLDDVNFDDFDLDKYNRKTLLVNDNPNKGTQTDVFNETPSITESEIMRTEEEVKQIQTDESEESMKSMEEQQERERERTQKKSVMRRVYDAMFGEDDFKEERDEMRSRRQQKENDDDDVEASIEKQQSQESDNSLPMNVKKSYEPSPSSSRSSRGSSRASSSSRRSANRSVLLPVEEDALSEHIHSSPPETIQSSVTSNRTTEYVDDASPPQSIISSRRSQETLEYIRSRSSSNSRRTISS